ncbi:MAG: EamA family transporter RarD [Neisseria sp.]|nr:EamA family transporter RarD [Neisseria sp.]
MFFTIHFMTTITTSTREQTTQGLLYAAACYLLWGIFPLYWYPLNATAMPAEQILAQRIVWSALFALMILPFSGQNRQLLAALRDRRLLLIFFGSAAALSVNWLTYLWAVTHHHVLDAGLGYFITPLVAVLLGRIVLHEILRPTQLAAIAIAAGGVLYLTWLSGGVPVVAVILALSFGFYGLLRKIAPLPALAALVLETLWMLPFALLYLLWADHRGDFYFTELAPLARLVLIGSGVVTTIPLLLFAAGAKRISLANMGMIQYISPTLQFIIGLTVFHEPFNIHRLIGYAMVWLAVLVYLAGSLRPLQKPVM